MPSSFETNIPVSVYAYLAAAAYADFWSPKNRVLPPDLPAGWTYLQGYSQQDTTQGLAAAFGSGFSASTFINAASKNIVISFEGTDLGDLGKTSSDFVTDAGLALGLGSSQLTKAALLYEAVNEAYPASKGYTISFTGHSLGAGLASIMAVWFNRPATVIDDAPFLATAVNTVLAAATYAALVVNGYADQSIADFVGDASLVNGSDLAGVISRESLVTAYYTQGEVLNKLFGFAGNKGTSLRLGSVNLLVGTVYGSNIQMSIGGGSGVGMSQLHSVVLATLLQMSKGGVNSRSFQSDTFTLPSLISQLLDPNLYSTSPLGPLPDFMTELMNASSTQLNANGKAASTSPIAMFSADLAKLGDNTANTGPSKPLISAVIAATIESYYYQLFKYAIGGDGYSGLRASTFLNSLDGGVSFDTANLDLPDHVNSKAIPLLDDATDLLLVRANGAAENIINNAKSWYVEAGGSGLVASGSGSVGDDVFIGGSTENFLIGGAGDNVLIGGSGEDTLVGGAGNGTNYFQVGFNSETLEGIGAGDDIYQFDEAASVGTDQITDRSGDGAIWVQNTRLTGSTGPSNGFLWTASDGTNYSFLPSVSSTGQLQTVGQLQITKGDLASGDVIIIDNFDLSQAEDPNGSGFLGIKFSPQLAIVAGASTDPFNSGARPANSAILAAGSQQTITIFAAAVSEAAQSVSLNLSGADSSLFSVTTGASLLQFAAGSLALSIPAGQDSITVGLNYTGTGSQAQTAQLTASVNDSGASPGTVSNSFTVTFPGAEAAASATNVITGEVLPGGAYAQTLPVTDFSDDYAGSNNQVTGSAGPNLIQVGSGGDSIAGGAGNDTIDVGSAISDAGNNTIAGGGGQDIIQDFDNGNNQIYAGSVVSLGTALAQGGTASNSAGDFISVGNGNNTIVGGEGNDTINVGSGDNTLILGPGSDIFVGGIQTGEYDEITPSEEYVVRGSGPFDDVEVGLSGQRSTSDAGISGYVGNTIADNQIGAGSDTIYGGTGNSFVLLPNGNNYVDAGGGNDTIYASIGDNTIFGGAGDDTIYGGGGNDYVDAESGNDLIGFYAGNSTVYGGTGNDTIFGAIDGSDWATVEGGTSDLEAGSGNDELFGSGGSDTLVGGSGDDTLSAGSGTELLEAGSGTNLLQGGAGNDTLIGGSGTDTLLAGDGATSIQGGDGDAAIQGGSGTDTISAGDGNDSINAGSGNTTITGGDGTDTIYGGSGTDVLSAGDGGTDSAPTYVTAGSGDTTITGSAGIDAIFGGAGTDVLYAGNGGDSTTRTQVTAGSGDTTIYGGDGVDNILGGSGTDVIYTGDGGTSGDPTVVTVGDGDTTVYGGAGINQCTTGSGDDLLVAGSGTNVFIGGAEDATYQIDSDSGTTNIWDSTASDTLAFGPGITIAQLSLSQTTYTNGVSDTFTTENGSSVTVDLGGITQVSFADGTDATVAQLLSPTFTVGNTTYSSVDGTLAPDATDSTDAVDAVDAILDDTGPATQNLTLTGNADLTGTGNNVDDVITANSGNDTLTAGTANDTLIGGGSSDDYVASAAAGTVTTIEDSSSADTLTFSAAITAADLSVSAATATDGSLVVTLQNNEGGSVVVDEGASGGVDQISFADGSSTSLDEMLAQLTTGPTAATSSATITLADGIQNMTLTGTADITATANSQDDVITANGGNDTLIAGSGNDTFNGGAGATTYDFNEGDGNLVIDNSGADDTLTFGAGIDESNLTTSAAVVNGITVVTITDDQGGSISIDGGALNQVAFADGSSASLTQLLDSSYSEGSTTYSAVSSTAGSGITTLDMTGVAAVTATANDLNDTLIANAGDDTLVAGVGNDTVIGGGGADTYEIAAGAQTTTIEQSGLADTLAFAPGVELSDLTASSSTAADGSTVITVNNDEGGSVVIDASDNGPVDQLSFADGTTGSLSVLLAQATTGTSAATSAVDVTLAAGVQNMTLTGNANLTTTANDLDDVITANGGDDTLIAGTADDTLVGGTGATTYDVGAGDDVTIAESASGDTLAFAAGIAQSDLTTSSAVVDGVTVTTIADDQGGIVTIQGGGLSQVSFADGTTATLAQLLDASYTVGTTTYSTVSTTAGSGIDTLDLTGSASVMATANGLNDLIQSNSGNDTLVAGSGSDTLVGGLGSTTYLVGVTSGVTTIEQAGDADSLEFGPGITAADLTVTQALAADGSITVTITDSIGNDVVIDDYSSGAVDQLTFADGSTASLSALLSALPSSAGSTSTVPSGGWQLANGSYGSSIQNADGSITVLVTDPDGSHSTTTVEPNGDSTTLYSDGDVETGSRSITVSTNAGNTVTTTDEESASGSLESSTVVTADGQGDSTTVRYGANGNRLGSTQVTVNAGGSVTSQTFNVSGQLTGSSLAVTQTDGSVLTTMYDANGNVTGSSDALMVGTRLTRSTLYNAAGVESGTSTTTSNGQGDSDTETYNTAGIKTSDSWSNTDGTSGSTTYHADGSTTVVVQAADGSYSSTANDGKGDEFTSQYNAAGVKTGDSWQDANGSSGFDDFNADGSTLSETTNADGSRTETINDGMGDITTTSFTATGRESGYSKQIANGASTTIVFNSDGYSTETVNDGQGNVTTTQFNANGVDTGDTYTRANGTAGSDTFNADGSSSSTTKNADGTSTTTAVNASGDITVTYFNASGTATHDTRSNIDGSKGTDTFNSDGSSNGTTINADGSYSSYVNDGHGDVTTSYYSANGSETSDSYTRADGSSGTDIFNPDGSQSGTMTSASGVTTSYTQDSSGQRVTTGSGITDADSAEIAAMESNFASLVSASLNAQAQSELGHAPDSSITQTPVGLSVVNSDAPVIQGSETGGVRSQVNTSFYETTSTELVPTATTVTIPGAPIISIEPLTYVNGIASIPAGATLVTKYYGEGQSQYIGYAIQTGTTGGSTKTTTTYTTQQVTSYHETTTITVGGTIEEIDAGPDTTTVYLGAGQDIVNVGSGNTFVGQDGTSSADESNPAHEEEELGQSLTIADDSGGAFGYVPPALGSFIYGGSGNDTLLGSSGSDTLVAGTGNDFLNGEGGKDTYVINTAVNQGTDIIDDTGYYDVSDYDNAGYLESYGGRVPTAAELASDFLHTVEFNGDVTPDQLQFSWSQVPAAGDRWALDISWGTTASVEVVMADADLPGEGIQQFTFSDGTTLTLAQMLALAPPHPADPVPVVTQTLPALQAGPDLPVNYTIPAGLFTDADPGDSFTVTVTQADGSALPSWLTFDPQTLTLSGTPPAGDLGTLALNVVGTDISGQSVEAPLAVTLYNHTVGIVGNDQVTTFYDASGDKVGEVLVNIYNPNDVTHEVFNPDGSYVATENDGYGDITTTYYNSSGVATSDSYTYSSGISISGTDIFNADGSSTGTQSYPDGSSSTYVDDGQGYRTTTSFDANGVKTSDSISQADGSYQVDNFNADGSITSSTFEAGDLPETMVGASGNDTYYVNNVGDVVQAQGENNTVYSSVSYTAPNDVDMARRQLRLHRVDRQ
jgi:Ca2+-binding RTX toxin-like protein